MAHSNSSTGSSPYGPFNGVPSLPVEEELRRLLDAARRRETRLRREVTRLEAVVERQGAQLHALEEENHSLLFDISNLLQEQGRLEERLKEREALLERRGEKILLVARALGVTPDLVSPDLPSLYPSNR